MDQRKRTKNEFKRQVLEPFWRSTTSPKTLISTCKSENLGGRDNGSDDRGFEFAVSGNRTPNPPSPSRQITPSNLELPKPPAASKKSYGVFPDQLSKASTAQPANL
jgi:hypothetical protein